MIFCCWFFLFIHCFIVESLNFKSNYGDKRGYHNKITKPDSIEDLRINYLLIIFKLLKFFLANYYTLLSLVVLHYTLWLKMPQMFDCFVKLKP